MRLILESPDELVDPETIALGINLACSPRNVQIMCSGPGLKLLLRRALKSKDSLLFKMIRNISNCSSSTIKKLFLVSVHETCACETTGILALIDGLALIKRLALIDGLALIERLVLMVPIERLAL